MGSNFPSTEFVWGSCQYDDAEVVYREFCSLEQSRGRLYVLERMRIGPGDVKKWPDVVEDWKKEQEERLKQVMNDIPEELPAALKQLLAVETVTDALHFLRDSSWDLWAAVPTIVSRLFPALVCREDTAAGKKGLTIMGVTLQSDSGATGLGCWLLRSFGFVDDTEPFTEFDT